VATSFDPAPLHEENPWHDRDDRLTTILMIGRLVTATGEHLCRIRNISPDGMLIECDTALAIGDAVEIELRNLNVVAAHVRWIREGRVGVQFMTSADVEELLHQPAGTAFRPRAPRLGASSPIVLWHIGRNYGATLVDLSQTGCRVAVKDEFPAGADVRLTIPGLPSRHAALRWSRMGIAGFAFNEPLSYADLKAWDSGR